MSHPTVNPPRRTDGATAVTDAPRRRRWLLALLALLALSRCGNHDDTNATPGSASASASATGGSAAAAGEADGTITTGSTVILGDGGVKDMNADTGQQAQGRSVPVQSVPADEGFWVGTSATDRVWVQLTGNAGESPYQVKQGDLVNFNGTITPAGKGFADQIGLSAAEGADQLTEQKQYVLVKKADVQLAR